MAIGEDIVRQWRLDHVAAAPGASDADVQAFERSRGVRLPEDFRQYLQLADGTGGQMDGDQYRFWSLQEIRPVAEVLEHHQPDSRLFEGCFVFADYSISAWLYAIQLIGDPSEVGRVYRVPVDGTRGDPLAQTFSEFGRLYLDALQCLEPRASGKGSTCFPAGLVAVVLVAHAIALHFSRRGPLGFDAVLLAAGSLAGISLMRWGHWLHAAWPVRFVLMSGGTGVGIHCWLTLVCGPPGPGWLGLAFGVMLALFTVTTEPCRTTHGSWRRRATSLSHR